MSAHLRWAIVCSMTLCGMGCEQLWPPPSDVPELRWNIRDPRIRVLLAEDQSCDDKLSELIGHDACTLRREVRGDEAACVLRPPFLELLWSCGPEPVDAPRERLRLRPNSRGYLRFLERVRDGLGSCRVMVAHRDAPRFGADPGLVACFFDGPGGLRSIGSASAFVYPSGVFFEYDARMPEETLRLLLEHGPFAVESPSPLALEFDTSMLDDDERALVMASFGALLDSIR